MEEFKDTFDLVIGKIPKSWDIKKIKYIANIKTGGTPPDKEGIDFEGEYPWITAPDIDESLKINNYSQYISEDAIKKQNYKLFPKNSILLVCIASVGKIGITKTEVYSNQQITAIMPNKNIDSLYLLYYLKAYSKKIIKDAASNVVPIVNSSYLNNIITIMPSLNEQKSIAKFLDKKTSKINSIIESLNKQISILQNYKKSKITEVITRGLKENTLMKDSNIKWIGYIPQECNVIRLKDCSYLKGRIGWQGLTSDEFIDEGPFCVTGTDFINGDINWDTCYHISKERYDMDYNIQLKKGDLLITKDGTIGKLARINNLPGLACLNSHLLIIRPLNNKFTNNYLYYVLSSGIFEYYTGYNQTGSTMESLSQEKIGNFSFPIYDIDEQERIAKYLDLTCFKIDNMINKKQKQLNNLEKYKQSLIYEYVTGKKRVKGE